MIGVNVHIWSDTPIEATQGDGHDWISVRTNGGTLTVFCEDAADAERFAQALGHLARFMRERAWLPDAAGSVAEEASLCG